MKILGIKCLISMMFLLLFLSVKGQTSLSAGDIAIIGVNTDSPDNFAFVTFVDLAANTEINFTDNGWDQNDEFYTNEGHIKYTAPSAVAKGTVITFPGSISSPFSSISGSFNLSNGGDQIIAYQDTSINPKLLFALNISNGWETSGTINSNLSYEPSMLASASATFDFGSNDDNGIYNINANNGTPGTLLSDVTNAGNWITDNSPYTFPGWSFSVTSGTIGTSTINAGSVTLATISSLHNSSGSASDNFDFEITDDGATPGTDTLPLILETIQINSGAGNEVTDWTEAIEGAELTDGINTVAATTINADNLVFDGLDTTAGGTGRIEDDSSKIFVLKIWLKSSPGGNLPASIDGSNFVFEVTGASFTVPISGSSVFANAQSASSGGGYNEVTVSATELQFGNIPTIISINTNFTVAVNATDANGNIDLDELSAMSLVITTGTGNLSSSTGLNQNLVGGTFTWSDVEYDITDTFTIEAQSGTLTNTISQDINAVASLTILFDDFNRPDSNVAGIPSSGGMVLWNEHECDSTNDKIVIESNSLILYNNSNRPGCTSCSNPSHEELIYDMSGKYATVFSNAEYPLVWYFNLRQSRGGGNDPSGFGSGNYGAAMVLGSNEADFNSGTANGYALVIGNSGTDPWRLVYFTGGLSSLGVSQGTNIVTVSSGSAYDDYWSFKVTYDPCSTNENWTLQARNDSSSAFADPTTIMTAPAKGTNHTHTLLDLKYFGAAWFHSSSCVESMMVDNISVPTAPSLDTAIYTWTGTSGYDFQQANNWSPFRNCHRATDILLFNDGNTDSLVNIPTQTFARIKIENGTRLILRNNTGSTSILTLNGQGDTALTLAYGSSLIWDGNNPVQIKISEGTRAFIKDSIIFRNLVNGFGRAHRLLATDSAGVVFKSGAVFLAQDLSGNPFADTGQTHTTIFENGSVYIANDGGNPFGLSQPQSKVVFEGNSNYIVTNASVTPALSGRSYGNVEIDAGNTMQALFGAKGNKVTMQNLLVRSGSTWNITYHTSGRALDLEVLKDLTIEAGGTLSFDPDSTSYLIFAGSDEQKISVAGTLTLGDSAGVRLNSTDTVRIQKDIMLDGFFDLSKGILDIGNYNIRLGENAKLTGGTANSYVATSGSGFLQRTVPTANPTISELLFPMGHNPYLPVKITCTDCAGGEVLKMKVHDGITSQPDGNGIQQTTDAVLKTWIFDTPVTATDTHTYTITVQWNATDQVPNPGANNPNNYTGFGYALASALAWNQQQITPADNPSPGIYTQTITGVRLGKGSTYVFGVGGDTSSPVPVELISFTGDDLHGDVLLKWATASEINNSHFEIERNTEGAVFEKIGEIAGAGTSVNSNSYVYLDVGPAGKVIYYRLRQVDFDGEASYSNTVVISRNSSDETHAKVLMNPVKNLLPVEINLIQESLVNIRLIDMAGRIRLGKIVSYKAGVHIIKLETGDIPVGFYLLRTETNGQVFTSKILILD